MDLILKALFKCMFHKRTYTLRVGDWVAFGVNIKKKHSCGERMNSIMIPPCVHTKCICSTEFVFIFEIISLCYKAGTVGDPGSPWSGVAQQ
jgi:hypothetical protein